MWFLDLRVSEKRAVSFYGLNSWPFTLYAAEWKAVFASRQIIRRYIDTHHVQLDCRCADETKENLRRSLERDDILRGPIADNVRCRTGQKRGVSLYGIRRYFPITLYCAQWLYIFENRESIEQFIKEQEPLLDTKGCCVPRIRQASELRPMRESVGADNIIRPMAARGRE
jgi:hypothetical protein